MVNLKYKNTKEQFLDFSMYRAVNSKSYKRSVKIKTAMVSGMLFISSIVYGYVSKMRSYDEKIMKVGFVFSGIFFVLGILNIFAFKYYIKSNLRKTLCNSLKNNGDIFGKTIKINFDGKTLNAFSGKTKLKISLDLVKEIIEMNECVCISVKNDAGLVIPVSAFKNEKEKQDFIDQIRKSIN